jgi:hypothetical protein
MGKERVSPIPRSKNRWGDEAEKGRWFIIYDPGMIPGLFGAYVAGKIGNS